MNASADRPEIVGIIFSRDRAMQLEAALRSLSLHCLDLKRLNLSVLYACSAPLHAKQYRLLAEAYKPAGIRFIQQVNFRRDCLAILTAGAASSRSAAAYQVFSNLGWRGARLRQGILPNVSNRYWLFGVDDSLFVQDFRLETAVQALSDTPRALGFSLRLGLNTNYCYPLDCPQSLPEFAILRDQVLAYNWTEAEHDFSYPLEVSSSIYRAADLLPMLDGLRFKSPNQLEIGLADRRRNFSHQPLLLCFTRSAAFSIPINTVNRGGANRSGKRSEYSDQTLAEQFDSGMRIDVDAYAGFTPNACHQEVELRIR